MNKSVLPPHGGYQNLKSYQTAVIVYDLTLEFCKKYIDRTYGINRTHDQMVQAARSGCQNIAEGSQTSGTSKQSELRLIHVARASLEELLADYKDFLRQNKYALWAKDDTRTQQLRALAYRPNRSYATYSSYLSTAEHAANCLVSLIHQTNFLLDQQLRVLEKELIEQGDIPQRLRRAHQEERKRQILGPTPEERQAKDDQFLKENGFKRLPNGKVVKIDE